MYLPSVPLRVSLRSDCHLWTRWNKRCLLDDFVNSVRTRKVGRDKECTRRFYRVRVERRKDTDTFTADVSCFTVLPRGNRNGRSPVAILDAWVIRELAASFLNLESEPWLRSNTRCEHSYDRTWGRWSVPSRSLSTNLRWNWHRKQVD